MRMRLSKSVPTFRERAVSPGLLIVAIVLLVGVMVLAYGFFQQSRVGLGVGLVVILAGALNGVLKILARHNR